MTPNRWIDLMHKFNKTAQFIVSDSRAHLDRDMFAIMSGPTLAAISVVFDHAEFEDVYQTCTDGYLAVAKVSACHHLEDVLDDLVVSLCKFTTLLNPSSVEEPVLDFGDDTKSRMATEIVLPLQIAHMTSMGNPRRSSGLMGRFSPLLSLDTEEPRLQPTEQQLAAHQRTFQTIQKCHIDRIFTEDRIGLLWHVYEQTSNIFQSTVMPCALDEKAVFGLLRICQRLLPYK
ncbi:unnamed protein product [Ilex paraguariensis]|uniref:Uncharacterized protein n=1 Tax=Ilex paraguariensis TaxID=185542 RepID=A0ABC8UE73_9AQUA